MWIARAAWGFRRWGCTVASMLGGRAAVQPKVNPRAVYLEAPCTASITVPDVLSAMRVIRGSLTGWAGCIKIHRRHCRVPVGVRRRFEWNAFGPLTPNPGGMNTRYVEAFPF